VIPVSEMGCKIGGLSGRVVKGKIFHKLMTIGEEMLILLIDVFTGFYKSLLY
jgi:hypothetical protein